MFPAYQLVYSILVSGRLERSGRAVEFNKEVLILKKFYYLR